MKRNRIIIFCLLIFVLSISGVSAGNYKYDSIKVKFVDSLSLNPLTNSQIRVYYDTSSQGDLTEETYYTTNLEGEIIIPIMSEIVYVRSDKGNNQEYVSQGEGINVNLLAQPEYIIYMNPIFDIEIELQTNFNFLLSFFRMFRYGSMVEMPSSKLSLDSVVEPSCSMTSLKKGETISQYSKAINIRAYYSRDLNSPTKEPNKCTIYAWESIRKDAGRVGINFEDLSRTEINKIELTLDEGYDSLMEKLEIVYPTGPTCSDGTSASTCSLEKPKFCYKGEILNNCEQCGCDEGFSCNTSDSSCIPLICLNDEDCDDNSDLTTDVCVYPGEDSAACVHNIPLKGKKKLLIIEFAPQDTQYGALHICYNEDTGNYYSQTVSDYCGNVVESHDLLEILNDPSGQVLFANAPKVPANLNFNAPYSFFIINEYLKDQARNYNQQDIPIFDIDLVGPFELNDLPPETEGVSDMNLVNEYFDNKIKEQTIDIGDYDLTAIVYFNDEGLITGLDQDRVPVKMTENRHKFTNHAVRNLKRSYLSIDTMRMNDVDNVHILIHETLHHFGASDKYVFAGEHGGEEWCKRFTCCTEEGVPIPNQYPQTKGCTMCAGGTVVIEKGIEGQAPESLGETIICSKTAEEIGWI